MIINEKPNMKMVCGDDMMLYVDDTGRNGKEKINTSY